MRHWIGHRPLAARVIAFELIKLTHNARALCIGPVVKFFLQLVFNDLTLFFNHQNLFQAFGKLTRALRLKWPNNRNLVNPNTQALAGLGV